MNKNNNIVISNFFTMIYKYIFGIAKVIIGIFKFDYFYCVSGVYNILIGTCKNMFLYGKNKNIDKQLTTFKNIAVTLIVSSLFYIIYATSFFSNPKQFMKLGILPTIVVAIFSLLDFLFSLYGVLKNIIEKNIMSIGSKCISLCGANTCSAFTFICILELFGNEINYKVFSIINGIIGVTAGLLCLLIGISMLMIVNKHKDELIN